MSELKKGALLSYVTIILTNCIGLLLTPFIIRYLGVSEYGLYTLIGSTVAAISVMDFGLNNTIVRFVARYRVLGDRESEESFLAMTMLIYGVISTLIAIGGIFCYFYLGEVFQRLTTEQLEKAKIMFGILILDLSIALPSGAFTAICSAYEHFVFPRILNIIKYVLRSLMIIGLLFLGGDSVGIVILDTIMNILGIAVTAYYVFKKLDVVFRLHTFEWTLIKQIFSYSTWIFIYAMIGQIYWRSGQMVLGVVSGPEDVAIYGVGIMLGTYYGTFSAAVSNVFLPRATKMVTLEATPSELTDMMIKIGRFSLIILLLILGGFLLYGHQFVMLWVGKTYSDSWFIAAIVMVSYTLPLIQTFANSLLEAQNKFAFKSIVYIVFLSLGVAIGIYLERFWGPTGIIIGSSSGWLISQVVMNLYFRRVLHLEIGRFLKETVFTIVPAFCTVLIIGYFINMIPGIGWGNLLIKIVVFTTAFTTIMFKFGINNYERDVFIQNIPLLKRKKK